MSLLDPAFLAACEIVKHLAQMPFYFAEQQRFAVLRREHDMVLALPGRVIKMIELHFHHGLLEDLAVPRGDRSDSATQLPKL